MTEIPITAEALAHVWGQVYNALTTSKTGFHHREFMDMASVATGEFFHTVNRLAAGEALVIEDD